MQISISNAIESLRRGGARIIQFGLQLWLDFNKSEIIGSDLVVNGDFATDLSGWTLDTSRGSYAWDVGRIKITNDAANSYANCSQDIATTIGGIYRVRGTVEIGTATTIEFRATRVGGNATQQLSSDGTIDFTFIADQASTKLLCYLWSPTGNTDNYCYFDNVSVKEVTQFVMDKSPNTNNAKLFTGKALSFDGVNDEVDFTSTTFSGEFTAAIWFKVGSGQEHIIGMDNSANNQVYLNNGSQVVVKLDGQFKTFNLDTFTDDYSRLVIVRDSNDNLSVYVNNIESSTGSDVRAGDFTIDTFGRSQSNYGLSTLSDFQIYNKAWTASDVTFDYNNPNHLAIDNPDTDLIVTDLKAYWALSEGDGLVAYDSGSTLEEDVVQNGDFSKLGSEEVVNGDFATDSDWTKGDGWSIANGVAVCDGTQTSNTSLISSTMSLAVGETYKVTVNVSSTSSGFRLYDSDSVIDYSLDVGENVFYRTPLTSNYAITSIALVGSTGSISNISVKQVDPNDEWTLGTGWSYGNDKVISDGTATAVQQNGLLTIDSTYQITATVTGNPSLLVFNSSVFYNDLASRTLSNGTNTYILKAKAINFAITNAGGDSCDVTNISVTEITPSDHGGIINGATYVPAQDTIPQLGMMDWAKGSNLYLSSEPTANESAAGDISYGSYSWGLNGFSNATIFGDNSVLRYRYGGSTTIGVEYTLSAFVIMDDNSEPDVTNLSSSGDFSLVVSGSVGVGVISKTNISGNIWRVSKVKTAVASTTSNGIVKYTTQSAKGFKVVGWQIEESSSVGNYILTDGAAAIDVTTIQNPTNKGYDILGNALRLREHAFNLDGSGYAEVADNGSLDFGTGEFSMEAWLVANYIDKGETINVAMTLGGDVDATGTAGLAVKGSTSKIRGYVNSFVCDSDATFTVGKWYHVVLTRSSIGLCELYIDAQKQVDTETTTGTVSNASSKLIGKDSNINRGYEDLIDDTRIYNRALTQKEITQNYNVGLPAHTNPSSYSGDYSSDYGF